MHQQSDINAVISMIETLRGANLQSRTPAWIDDRVYELLGKHQILGITRSKGQIWHRARKASDRDGYRSLHEMIYPPASLVDYGRANLPKSPVLYASWNVNTAYDEISALPGNYIQTISIRPVAGVEYPCAVVGEYHSILTSGRSLVNSRLTEQRVASEYEPDGTAHLVPQYIDAFLADIFRRAITKPHEYRLSAIVAHLVTGKNWGLIYPSFHVAHSMNIAVPMGAFNAAFEVISTAVLQIDRALGYGIYEAKLVKASSTFHRDGTIDWEAENTLLASWNLQEGVRTLEDPAGWRVTAPT